MATNMLQIRGIKKTLNIRTCTHGAEWIGRETEVWRTMY